MHVQNVSGVKRGINMGFLYRFINKENNVIYIGKTTKSLSERLRQHSHLPTECYQNIYKIEYMEIKNEGDLHILEIYYINKYLPLYNSGDRGSVITTIQLISPPNNWKEFDFKAMGIDINSHLQREKKETEKLPKEEIMRRQKIGIERAKAEGKFKGRKPIQLDEEKFKEGCIQWRNGECTAVSLMKKYKLSSPTFYRKVNERGY